MATEQSITLDNSDGSELDSKINIPLHTDNKDTDVKSVKRKRGRPSKNLENNKVVNYEPRKKRNVTSQVQNYNDLLGEDSSDGNESDSLYCKTETKPKEVSKVKKKRGRPSKKTTHDLSSCVEQEETKTVEIQLKEPHKTEEVVLEDVKTETITESNDAIETDSNKSSKYKKTGQKAVIMKHLFRGLQGKSTTDQEDNKDLGQSKRKKGRPKAKPDSSSEDGETTCMVCNETIQMCDWWKHKRERHNNLAWKQGDLPMDLQDRAIVQKTLTQLRKEQGYLKCHKCESEFSTVKKFIDHYEICNGIEDSNGFVRCAICDTQMVKTDWAHHRYRQHNNLAWRVGDTPLNLEDQDTVMHILSALYKLRKPLYCEICREQKKSVLGYLSHKSVCQLGGAAVDILKVACEVCGKKVLPVSLDFHMKIHNKPKEELPSEESQVSDRPRKAATQALQVIKGITGELGSSDKYYSAECDFQENFVVTVLQKIQSKHPNLSCIFTDCTFKSVKVENMVAHLKSCDRKPAQYYVCKVCLTWTSSEEGMTQHVKGAHRKVGEKDGEFEKPQSDTDESGDDEVYYEGQAHKKKISSKTKTQMINKDFTRVIPLFLLHPIREDYSKLVYPQAYPWTLSFCEKYYAKTTLFENFRNATPWPLLDCDILDHYLPKSQQSCDVIFVSFEQPLPLNKIEKLEFSSLDLFEVRRHDKDSATVFCGGPVTSLAWLPTPYTEQKKDQILAVAVLNDWDTEYSIKQTYKERSVVQFWNFGPLSSKQENDFEPCFLYGLALNSGPVWSLEWCPSGCIDICKTDSSSRLGLLAVAASDSFVYIYSVDIVDDDTGFIYKGEPVVKLQLSSEFNSNECYATKISWTKAAGHRYIAVGYTNGVLAFFDLVSTSALLRRTDSDGVQIIFPYNIFQGHFTQIIGLTLSHLDGGNRFCCSSSHDKMITYWDLFNNSKVFSWRLNSVVESLWPVHWPMCVTGEDETTFTELLLARTYLTTLRHSLTSTQKTICTNSPSGINSVGFSDWLNLVLHGGNAGEIMGMFAHRLFANVEQKRYKKKYTKCIFSTNHLIKKNQTDEDKTNQFTFQQMSKHYGLALVDYNSYNINGIPNSTNKKITDISNTLTPLNITNYPLQAVSKVVPNPNQQAYSFYATGLQAGLVRVRRMRFLDNAFQPLLSFMDQSFTEHL